MGEGRAPSAESHPFPADKPGPRAAPVSPPRASPVPAPRRPAAASCSTHLESVPDGRAATRAPGTDSELARWRRRRGGGKRGHAKGPPGRGRRAGPSEGRAEAAPRRAHTRTHALPLHPRPLPARGAARRPRGTVQPVGDCRQLQGRPRPSPSFRPARGAPPARPRRRLQAPRGSGASPPPRPARLFRLFPHPRDEEKKCSNGCRPGLGGKASFFSFSSPRLLSRPRPAAAWNRLGARPVGPPPEPPEG